MSRSGLAKRASTWEACCVTWVRARRLRGRLERGSAEVGMDSGMGSDIFCWMDWRVFFVRAVRENQINRGCGFKETLFTLRRTFLSFEADDLPPFQHSQASRDEPDLQLCAVKSWTGVDTSIFRSKRPFITMADPLYELLVLYFDTPASPRPVPNVSDQVTAKYLNRLSTLPLASLTSTEPQSLAQSSHTTLLSLQSLSARSNPALVASSDHLSSLRTSLPQLAAEAENLRHEIPKLDAQAVAFSEKYSRSAENEVLDRRKKALLMTRNVDRLSDILDLPTLLASAISSSTAQGASSTVNYASALDLHSHIKRLHLLYQDSELVSSIYQQTEEAMREMASNLIASLRSQNIKLAGAMRTIGWLRRVAPELDGNSSNREGTLGALFLVCRLATLVSMLSALDPLRNLAEQETATRLRESHSDTRKTINDTWSGGQQTERYLKRYIEIFREQSFAIISMYKSIFPSGSENTSVSEDLGPKFKTFGLRSVSAPQSSPSNQQQQDPLSPLPSALATFPLHLVGLLTETLKQYLPNVRDKSSRESLLTQVLYCAGSLGRLGGDFSLMLNDLGQGGESADEDEEDGEWVEVMKKHRVLAEKLESLASGGGNVRGAKALDLGDGIKSTRLSA